MKYKINNIGFRTQKQVQDYAKGILYKDSIGSYLRGDDLDFMLAFFEEFHVTWLDKVGPGIKAIQRVKEPNYGIHRAFWLHRVDGTSTDISYQISWIKKKDYEREFKNALRWVIKPQIDDFKQSSFDGVDHLRCPLTGQIVTFQNCHIDHYSPQFDEIVAEFVKKMGISNFEPQMADSRDGQTKCELANPHVANLFFEFHRSKANLRVLSKDGNLSIAKKRKR